MFQKENIFDYQTENIMIHQRKNISLIRGEISFTH